MRPAPFEYHRAETIEHALELLAAFGEEGRPIAGGQSLVPMMNFRLARPSHLVDVNRLAHNTIEQTDAMLRIGALTRHCQLFDSALIAKRLPALSAAVHYIGHPTIRRNGSIGGSIAHADPTAELPASAVLADAEIVVRSVEGERRINAGEFFLSAYVTALEPGEMVVAVEFPLPSETATGSFIELGERSGDFAIASVGVTIDHSDGQITRAAMVCSGADLVPIRAPEVEAFLPGQRLDDVASREAGRMFAGSIDPADDHIAPAEYRKNLIAELTHRAIQSACAKALEKR